MTFLCLYRQLDVLSKRNSFNSFPASSIESSICVACVCVCWCSIKCLFSLTHKRQSGFCVWGRTWGGVIHIISHFKMYCQNDYFFLSFKPILLALLVYVRFLRRSIHFDQNSCYILVLCSMRLLTARCFARCVTLYLYKCLSIEQKTFYFLASKLFLTKNATHLSIGISSIKFFPKKTLSLTTDENWKDMTSKNKGEDYNFFDCEHLTSDNPSKFKHQVFFVDKSEKELQYFFLYV